MFPLECQRNDTRHKLVPRAFTKSDGRGGGLSGIVTGSYGGKLEGASL